MLTFQDFERGGLALIPRIISEHQSSELYQTALTADEYDRQKNTTIYNYVQTLFSLTGAALVDYTATNSRIAASTAWATASRSATRPSRSKSASASGGTPTSSARHTRR